MGSGLAFCDEWIGWNDKHRQKHLNLVINNNRFLIFPWVHVSGLASKVLAYAMQQVAEDWASWHGYKPVLVETFVDSNKYQGSCYKASNWLYIGQTRGNPTKDEPERDKKDVYLYPLHLDARELLTDNKQSTPKKVDPYKISKVLIDVEDFHAKTERGVKQELFAHFVMITLSRIFANKSDDLLLLKKGKTKIKQADPFKSNLKNCLTTLARNLEALFLRQIEYVKEAVHHIAESIATCYQKVRPNRSYKRESHKLAKKWRALNRNKKVPEVVVA